MLDFGTLIASGPVATVFADEAVRTCLSRGPRLMAAIAEPAGAPMLELRDVDAGYGPFRALFGVSLSVPSGGSRAPRLERIGKTTIARVCSGLIVPTSGQVLLDGDDLTGAPAHRYARLGVVHAPEGRSVFASLTVEENLELTFRRSRGRAGVRGALDEAYRLFPGSASGARSSRARSRAASSACSRSPACSWSSRACSSPTSSRSGWRRSSSTRYRTLETIRDAGTTLLIVEQHVHHALAIADAAVVMTKGEVAYAGPVSELGDLQSRLLGGSDGS